MGIPLTAICTSGCRQLGYIEACSSAYNEVVKPMGLASCLWLVGAVLNLDMASGHELPYYAIVMSNCSPSVVDNGDRAGAIKCCFLHQDSSYRSVVWHSARVDLGVHEYLLSFHKLLALLLSDSSRLPYQGKLSF